METEDSAKTKENESEGMLSGGTNLAPSSNCDGEKSGGNILTTAIVEK